MHKPLGFSLVSVTESASSEEGLDDVIINVFRTVEFWDILVAVASSLSAVGLVILIGFQWQSNRTNRRTAEAAHLASSAATASADEAQAANKRAAEEMDIRLRASIGIGIPIVEDSGFPSDANLTAVRIRLPIRNYGETPATNMDLFPRAGPNLQLLWDEINGLNLRRRNAIFPGEEFPLICWLTRDEYQTLTESTEVLYVAIRAYYSDYLNRDWTVESSYVMRGVTRQPVKIGVPTLIDDLPDEHPARIAYMTGASLIPQQSNSCTQEEPSLD